MEHITLFYSWQSDNEEYTKYINAQLNKLIENLKKEDISLKIDKATRDAQGAMDISRLIHEKIDKCDFFVCDISFVDSSQKREYINSNVAYETGYAMGKLGCERVSPVFILESGSENNLLFDFRNNRRINCNIYDKNSVCDALCQSILNFKKNNNLKAFHGLKKSDIELFESISERVKEFDQKRKNPFLNVYDKYTTTHADAAGCIVRGDFEWAYELTDILNDITQQFSITKLNVLKDNMLNKLTTALCKLNIETNRFNEVDRYECWSKYYLLAEHRELAMSKYNYSGTAQELEEYKKISDSVIKQFDNFIYAYQQLQSEYLNLS